MVQGLSDLVKTIAKYPWTIFVVFTLVFGYLYFDQNVTIQDMNVKMGDLKAETAGLQAEMSKMNEIIKLKVQLAEKECPIEEIQ